MKSKQAKAKDLENDETADEIARTMKLAAAAFDHPGIPEEEVEDLCEAAFSEDEAKKPGDAVQRR